MNKYYTGKNEQQTINPITEEHKKAFAETLDRYNVMGTFIFDGGSKITRGAALGICRKFLNSVDITYFGNQAKRRNLRIERDVFVETKGNKSDDWVHFHIFMQSIGNTLDFSRGIKKLWKQANQPYQVGVRLDWIETPIEPWENDASAYYGWKQDNKELGNNTWIPELSHTNNNSHNSHLYQTIKEKGIMTGAKDRLQKLTTIHG